MSIVDSFRWSPGFERERALQEWESEGGAIASGAQMTSLAGRDRVPGPSLQAVVADVIEIEASVIGTGLGIEPSLVQAGMREGRITTLCERGIGEDLGRYRATFYFGKRHFRILVDASGKLVEDF